MTLKYARFEVLKWLLMVLAFRDTTSCRLYLGAIVSESFGATI